MDRREFVQRTAAVALSTGALSRMTAPHSHAPKYAAIAFDAFPIFDPRSVGVVAESVFPGKSAELMTAWRGRQFEYQWLRALGGQYADFARTTDDALVFAAKSLRLELTSEARERLVHAYSELKAWPDVAPALKEFKKDGLRIALLSNMTSAMLRANIASAKLEGMFDEVISSDAIRSYKPDPRVYQLGVDVLNVPREKIAFAAFAGWDAAGASWFGYPTVWVNRAGAPPEELGAARVRTGSDIAALVSMVADTP